MLEEQMILVEDGVLPADPGLVFELVIVANKPWNPPPPEPMLFECCGKTMLPHEHDTCGWCYTCKTKCECVICLSCNIKPVHLHGKCEKCGMVMCYGHGMCAECEDSMESSEDDDDDDGDDEGNTEGKDATNPYPDYIGKEYTNLLKSWDVPYALNVTRVAADFYLLYQMHLDGENQEMLDSFLKKVVPIFVNYTDMAIGGELRHVYSRVNTAKAFKDGEVGLEYDKLIQRCDVSRANAWRQWKVSRDEQGLAAVEACRDYFNLMGMRVGFGGKLWGNIADTLLMYLKGELSDVLFLDLCFGLEHNGGKYLNKIGGWYYGKLVAVLDANLAGNMDYLKTLASKEVVEAYDKWLGRA